MCWNRKLCPPRLRGMDVVFNAAGVVDHWRQGVERMYQVNVEGTRNLMEAALRAGIERVVHTSSTAAMGIHPNILVDETFEFNVKPERFVYGHSKYLAEQIVLEYVRKGLPAVIVNPTTVIGPRDVRKVSCGMVVEVVKHCAPPLIPPGGLNVVPICDAAQGHIEAAIKGHSGRTLYSRWREYVPCATLPDDRRCGGLWDEAEGHAALAGLFHRRPDRHVTAANQRTRAVDRRPACASNHNSFITTPQKPAPLSTCPKHRCGPPLAGPMNGMKSWANSRAFTKTSKKTGPVNIASGHAIAPGRPPGQTIDLLKENNYAKIRR